MQARPDGNQPRLPVRSTEARASGEEEDNGQVPGLGDWCGNDVKTPSAATALDHLQENYLRLNKADCRPGSHRKITVMVLVV